MARQILLLRGINLGPTNRVPMPGLRELLAGLGAENVRTLVASGNVVLDGALELDAVERAIADAFGVRTRVVARSAEELAAVVQANPLEGADEDPKRYQVVFLSDALPAERARQIETTDWSPERVAVLGREVYTWHPEGIQRSPLNKALTDKRVGVVATARNWNTVTKLLTLAEG